MHIAISSTTSPFSAQSSTETSTSSISSCTGVSTGSKSSAFSFKEFSPSDTRLTSVCRPKPDESHHFRMEQENRQDSVYMGDEAGLEASTDFAGDTTNQGTLLLAVRELRVAMKNELQGVKTDTLKMLELQASLMSRMTVVEGAVQKLSDSSSIRIAATGPSRRRNYRSEPRLELLSATFGDSNAAVPLIQLACIITTTSLSKRMPELRGFVSEGIVNYLGGLRDVVGQTSGFGTLMFAVRGNAAKTKFKFATGQIWLFWLKRAMKVAITYSKNYMYCAATGNTVDETAEAGRAQDASQLPTEPAWLAALDTLENIESVINEAVQRLESGERSTPTTSSISRDCSPPMKRLRAEDFEDLSSELRFAAAMQIRGALTAVLNSGRAEVRSYLYLSLMFIVDRIREFANRSVARRAGFDVVFHHSKSEKELHPEDLSGVWDIPLARIGDPVTQRTAESGCKENLRILQKLQEDFSCLSLEIKYQREVKQAAGGLDRDGQRMSVEPTMWADVDKVSLHLVAAQMLMELVCAKTVDAVLAASKLSLRTVHILAIGLRALLLRSLESVEKKTTDFAVTDVGLTALERNVLGNVVYDQIQKSADLVSVKMDEVKAGGKQAVRLAINREKKLAISFEDYTKALEAAAERVRAQSVAQENAEVSPPRSLAQVDIREANDDWVLGG